MNGQKDEYVSSEEEAIKEQLESTRSRVFQLHDDIPCLKQCTRLSDLLQKMYEIHKVNVILPLAPHTSEMEALGFGSRHRQPLVSAR